MSRHSRVHRLGSNHVHGPYPEFEPGHDHVRPTPELLEQLRRTLRKPGTARSRGTLAHWTDQLGAWLGERERERERRETGETTARATEGGEAEFTTAQVEESIEIEQETDKRTAGDVGRLVEGTTATEERERGSKYPHCPNYGGIGNLRSPDITPAVRPGTNGSCQLHPGAWSRRHPQEHRPRKSGGEE